MAPRITPASGVAVVSGETPASGAAPVFEHKDFFVFDKPEGTSFHSEDGTGFFAQLTTQYPNETLFPVHRLDKITSGLLLVARNKTAAQQLGQLFESRGIHKTYLALSDHRPSKKQGLVAGDMQRTRGGSWKLLHSKQAPAITHFTSHSLAPKLRLFVLQPQTGRTHQLRVMMKALGSPILGDLRYGGTAADRGYLHAFHLHFDWHGEQVFIGSNPDGGSLFQRFSADILTIIESDNTEKQQY